MGPGLRTGRRKEREAIVHPPSDGPGVPPWTPPNAPPTSWGASPPTAWPGAPETDPAPSPHPTSSPEAAPPAGAHRPAAASRGAAMGLLAAVGGLAASVGPLLRWFENHIDVGLPGGQATTSTTGWGSTSSDLPVATATPDGPWEGWALAGVPDGVVATLLGVAVVVVGLRLAVGAGRGGSVPRLAITVLGLAGLAWMAVSWTAAQRMLSDGEETLATLGGRDPQAFADLFTLGAGSGFFLTATGFAVATLAGLGALWSETDRLLAPAPAAPPSPPAPPGPPEPPS